MFENILGQSAVLQIIQDINGACLAPAMLFHGPPASAKGSCALELARFISCENQAQKALWNCNCTACSRHKYLVHPDLLIMGNRIFSAEITASSSIFLKEPDNKTGLILFIRSVRKLLSRFNPILWEDEPKVSKFNSMLSSIEEDIDSLENSLAETTASNKEDLAKITASILKDSIKLEAEGISDFIPIAQIRRAAAWANLRPSGKGKILVIENADRMQEGARNSMLKLLEEPPPQVSLILATARPKTLLPTMLSRLRPYRFVSRDTETGKNIIRRVFKSEAFPVLPESSSAEKMINAYLDSFLPVSVESLDKLAAYFAASAAVKAAMLVRKKGKDIPEFLTKLGRHCSSIAETAGLEKSNGSSKQAVSAVIKGAENFESRYLFSRFLKALLNLVFEKEKKSDIKADFSKSPEIIPYYKLWTECTGKADKAVSIYNQSPALALENLYNSLYRGMVKLCVNS